MTTLRQRRRAESEQRYSFDDYSTWVTSGNATFPVVKTMLDGRPVETIADDFLSYVQRIYKRNGVVFACMAARQAVFAEVRFRFAAIRDGRIGAMFGSPELDLLERPFGPTSSTGDIATRMIQDADLAGNFYAVRNKARLWRRTPEKMALALDGDPAEEEFVAIAGYLYYPGGVHSGGKFHTYLPEQMCHWTPIPDPEAEYRGMSWMTPILREIKADGAATDHKVEFFGNAATPQMVVKTPADVMTVAQFEKFKDDLNRSHTGPGNRNKTLFLAPGADVQVVGKDFKEMDFGETQGRDETRICAASGVPAVIVGVKESLQGSSLNQGNYGMARRRFADITMRPLFRSGASALENIIRPPTSKGPACLWYDDWQIAAFREDRKDAADIAFVKAQTIRQLVDSGFEPSSVVAAVEAEDETLLVHTGLFSIQLQEAGSPKLPAPGATPAATPAV